MMRNTLRVVVPLLIVFSLACSEKQTTDNEQLTSIEDLLVKNNEIAGWSYSGTAWVANNITELTDQINGMATVYESHGFVEAAHQAYQGSIDGSTRTLGMTVFNQSSQTNAGDTYNDPGVGLSGAIVWSDGAGDAAKYARYGGLSQVLAFYSGPYFVLLEMNYDTEESLNILKQFALNVDGKIK